MSIRQTSLKYRGRKALTYDLVRLKQKRWAIENEVVERMLREMRPSSVLDCPVGTGRFLPLYYELSVLSVHGVDASEEMLALARAKMRGWSRAYQDHVVLEQGDATALRWDESTIDVAVCVRFLDLIEEEAMRSVLAELKRVARRGIVLTVRLGDEYVPKSNTATHDRARFLRACRGGRAGWCVVERVPVLNAGWEIVRLGR